MMTTVLMFALVCTAHAGFVQPLSAGRTARRAVLTSRPSIVATLSDEPSEPNMVHSVAEEPMPFNPAYLALGIAAFAAFQPEAAMAKGGAYGIFEGRIVSLAHPTVMALMCGPPALNMTTPRPLCSPCLAPHPCKVRRLGIRRLHRSAVAAPA